VIMLMVYLSALFLGFIIVTVVALAYGIVTGER
jgi:hypothetical protein